MKRNLVENLRLNLSLGTMPRAGESGWLLLTKKTLRSKIVLNPATDKYETNRI
jgi:hypothetical protein